MILIVGLRAYVKSLAVLTLACRNGHVAAHQLVKVTRRFSLFFVPLFPVGTRYYTVCSRCGVRVPWEKETALAAAAQHQPAAPGPPDDRGAPVAGADPVAPPLRPVAGPRRLDPPTAPSGWYADPAGEGGLRYWDGGAWTEAVHEGPGPDREWPAQ
jgi:hypothetical protein